MARKRSAVSGERASGFRGRHYVVLWLGAFLLTAMAVVWRQGAALATSRELQQLQKTRAALEVSRATLEGQVHRDQSRAVLIPLAAQRLGLRLPQDSEITILQDPHER